MTSPSEPHWSPQSGLTLLEMMVTLAILVLVMFAVSRGFNGPSPMLQARGLATEVIALGSEARQRAIRSGEAQEMALPDGVSNCDTDAAEVPVFFPDGSLRADRLCVEFEGQIIELAVDPLTGGIGFE